MRILKVTGIVVALGLLAGCAHKAPTTQAPAPSAVNENGVPDVHTDTKGQDVFPEERPATGKNVFIFDPQHTAWAAYNAQGERIKTGRASGGKSYCEDVGRSCKTVVGTFTAYREKGAECKSGKFPLDEGGGAPMPNCMFFYKGYAVHGSPSVPNHNASHGCIRVTPSAAEWLNHNVINPGTTVIVLPYNK